MAVNKESKSMQVDVLRGCFVQLKSIMIHYRLTQAGILRALSLPGFFLSTFLGSRVRQPAGVEC